MSEPFIGQISMFGGNFAPRGWAFCDGQLLDIASNTALFSILGTTYGGDGRTTFGLPDLRGRSPMHEGTGPGLTPRVLGAKGGTETNTLSVSNLPEHTHGLPDIGGPQTTNRAAGAGAADGGVYTTAGATGDATATTGGGEAIDNVHPHQVINFIIALTGTFPPRN